MPGGAPPIVIDEEEARERKKREREDLTATANKEQPAAPSSVDKNRQLSAIDIKRMRMLREKAMGM
jgi:hypothetical protein